MNDALSKLICQVAGRVGEAHRLLSEPTTYNMIKAARLYSEGAELLVLGVEEGGGDVLGMFNQQKEEEAAEAAKEIAEAMLVDGFAAWTISMEEN